MTGNALAVSGFSGPEALAVLSDGERGKLISMAQKLDGIAERMRSMRVQSAPEQATVNDLLGVATVVARELEEDRQQRKRPVLEEGRVIDAMYRPAQQAIDALRGVAARLLAEYASACKAKAREVEAARQRELLAHRAAAQRAHASGDREALSSATASMVQAMAPAHERSGVKSEFATTTIRQVPVVSIVDFGRIPVPYLIAAAEKDPHALLGILQKAVENGTEIPGVKVTYEDKLRIRSTVERTR